MAATHIIALVMIGAIAAFALLVIARPRSVKRRRPRASETEDGGVTMAMLAASAADGSCDSGSDGGGADGGSCGAD